MLKSAFNALLRIHSRPAMLKRLGEVDTYSPIKICASNYFRFLRGPEHTVIAGKEFIIPVDSIKGQFAQLLTFSAAPTTGVFKIKFGASETGEINFDATPEQIKTAIGSLPGLSNVAVTGSIATGVTFTMRGFKTIPALGQITYSTLDKTGEFKNTFTAIPLEVKRGDRILDGEKLLSVDEVMEMQDLGGSTMGFRVRCD